MRPWASMNRVTLVPPERGHFGHSFGSTEGTPVMSGHFAPDHPVRWSAAMERALYGPDGFYVGGEGAAGHFRTSATAPDSVRAIFAGALAELLRRVDFGLGRPDPLDCVDVGGGSGDLLEALLAEVGPDLRDRVRLSVVERRPRPPGLPTAIHWLDAIPDVTGLLLANEWLDNVPLDVMVANALLLNAGDPVAGESDRDGVASAVDGTKDPAAATGSRMSLVLVDHNGAESLGPAPTAEEFAWLARWWPSGSRRELGRSRDRAWAGAVSRVRRGLAVAIDYAHMTTDRPPYGTLTGFRGGHETMPVPDGSCDVTAHVAIDSVAAAGERAAALPGRPPRTLLCDQRSALRCLGVSGRRPDYAVDPSGFAAALQRASDCTELIDPAGLGAFTWLLQGMDLDPAALLR